MNRKQRRAQDKTSRTPSPAAQDPAALHAAGIDAYRLGHLEQAASLMARAIAADPQAPSFHYNLAIVRKAQGKLPEAAASYGRAIALKPDHADAHNNLGNIFKALGDHVRARASFEQALQLKPGNADTHYNLGVLCSEAGMREDAARHFRHCLEKDPEDGRGAAMLLAHLGLAEAPQRTSEAQLRNIYDVRAQFWDRERYFAHQLVADALKQHAPSSRADILDIGCGTGLVGALVRGMAARLDGVDLSPAMLEKARAKKLYDRLDEGDLVAAMEERAGRYDAIAAAATLIHFGDLGAIFRAAATALRKDGLFVFTVFPNETDNADFAVAASARLAQSGCFRHSAGYIERLATENALATAALEQVRHEQDQDGNPVPGLLAVLRKT
jgi:predicted TPR repeat methyltransferase